MKTKNIKTLALELCQFAWSIQNGHYSKDENYCDVNFIRARAEKLVKKHKIGKFDSNFKIRTKSQIKKELKLLKDSK